MRNQTPPELKEIARRIAVNIRRVRMLNGITMEQIGEHVGVTFQQVQKYENGKNRIPIEVLIAYSQILGVSISVLLEETTDDSGLPEIGGTDASTLRSLRKITCKKRKQIVRYVAKLMETWEAREAK